MFSLGRNALPVVWGLMCLSAGQSLGESRAPSDQRADAVKTERPAEQRVLTGRAALEKKLVDMLTNVTLEGTWQMTMGDGIQRPVTLTNPSPDSYQISKVEKTGDDHWIITARIRYADKDVELPVMVRILWTGDTPIITVDDLTMPILGTYTARVMFYRGLYAGTWFGSGYGGVMSGRIKKTDTSDSSPASKSTSDGDTVRDQDGSDSKKRD